MARSDGKAENQHYVPRVLLQNFAFPGSGKEPKIFAFDKSAGRSFATGINKIATERSYNDVTVGGFPASLEPALSRLEGQVQAPLSRLVSERDLRALAPGEMETLSFFVAAQFLRAKHIRETNRHINEAIANWVRERGGDPERVRGFRPVTDNEGAKAQHVGMIHSFAPRFGKMLLEAKRWILFSTHERDPFWISDNPVVRHNIEQNPVRGTLGLGSPGVEIYFPLAPTLLLGMWCPTNVAILRDGRGRVARMIERLRAHPHFVVGVDDVILKHANVLDQSDARTLLTAVETGKPAACEHQHVVFYNYLQTFWSERYVFSNRDDFTLAEEIIRDDAGARRGPRMRVN